MRVCNWRTDWRGLSAYSQQSFITRYKECLVELCIDTATLLHFEWPTCYLKLLARTTPSSYIMPIPVSFAAKKQISDIRLVLTLQVEDLGQATVILISAQPTHSGEAVLQSSVSGLMQHYRSCLTGPIIPFGHWLWILTSAWRHLGRRMEQTEGQLRCNSERHISTSQQSCWKHQREVASLDQHHLDICCSSWVLVWIACEHYEHCINVCSNTLNELFAMDAPIKTFVLPVVLRCMYMWREWNDNSTFSLYEIQRTQAACWILL